MIDIYTEKKNSKDWIIQNDLYFNLNTGNEEMTEEDINIIFLMGPQMPQYCKDILSCSQFKVISMTVSIGSGH